MGGKPSTGGQSSGGEGTSEEMEFSANVLILKSENNLYPIGKFLLFKIYLFKYYYLKFNNFVNFCKIHYREANF